MQKSNQSRRHSKADRPAKPYDGFPLFPHASGRWAKKIRQHLHYFGKWHGIEGGGWQAALVLYQQQRDDLHAGRTPRKSDDGLTLRDLTNRFLTAKKRLVDSGDLVARTFRDYHDVCERTIRFFGKDRLVGEITADDFSRFRAALSKSRGPVSLANDITRVRILFKWGYDSGLIEKPIRYGQSFQKPSRAILRKARAARGKRLFASTDILRILASASVPLRAMILLGVNCGFGNNDCAKLPTQAIDLDAGWVNYPRPKTGIPRRCPLWPKTVQSLKTAIATRPDPKSDADSSLVFITSRRKSWAKDTDDNPISKETAKLLKTLAIHRPGLNFYALRHTFETIAGETRDQVAVNAIMGHAPASNDMSSVYREQISDERLLAVTEHVRKWLFGSKRKAANKKRAAKSTRKPARKRSAKRGGRTPAK